MAELLIEVLSEEIPARMQAQAAADLERLVLSGLAEADQFEAEAEAALRITPNEAMHLQRNRQPVSGRSRQPGLVLQRRKVERRASDGPKDENSFVNDADTAYTVHMRESYLRT